MPNVYIKRGGQLALIIRSDSYKNITGSLFLNYMRFKVDGYMLVMNTPLINSDLKTPQVAIEYFILKGRIIC